MTAPARYSTRWWNEATIGCQALTGAYDQARLGLSAMRDQKADRDPVFETLINAILGHRGKLDKLPDPSPFRMTLLAAAKLPLPADALATAGPAALAVWATSDKEPIAARLAAGEKAEALGALPPAGLGLLYGAVEFKARRARRAPEERQAARRSAQPRDPLRPRAHQRAGRAARCGARAAARRCDVAAALSFRWRGWSRRWSPSCSLRPICKASRPMRRACCSLPALTIVRRRGSLLPAGRNCA